METLNLTGTILGGLGLFLLAIGMMTDGLKRAAGTSLRTLLSEGSKTPFRGIFSGFLITAIVQSFSAVTVASLGFVNAGLISMRQALGILYGSNIGTTMTGWLVALIGFKLNIQAFALPLIGVGMVLNLIKQNDRLSSVGYALVGFGLFFLGIDILKGAFEGIVLAFDISQFSADGITGIFLFLLIGFLMTVMTQSSSASIALTITAATSGIVGNYAAGAMVIGANIGTTSTAMIATIGATSNAKRTAMAQVIFNVATALVALALLPVIFSLIKTFTEILNFEATPAVSLALFHTLFNILGVLLIYPLNDRLANFLEGKFLTWEEQESNPKYLDKTVAQTPVLAVNALLLELMSIAEKITALFPRSVTYLRMPPVEIDQQVSVIKSLSSKVSNFIVKVESSAISEETTDALTTLMRVDQYFHNSAISVQKFAEKINHRDSLPNPELESAVQAHFSNAIKLIDNIKLRDYDALDEIHADVGKFNAEHDALKAQLISNATRATISIKHMTESIDCMVEMQNILLQWSKAFIRIQKLENDIDHLSTTKIENNM